jgi:hypothetical protein
MTNVTSQAPPSPLLDGGYSQACPAHLSWRARERIPCAHLPTRRRAPARIRPRARLAPSLICALALPASALAIDCPIPGPGWKFLGDLNYPDGTEVSPGAVINKGWRLQNCGTTDWVGFKAVRLSTSSFGPSEIDLPDASSLEIFDLYKTMTVPTSSGVHRRSTRS